LTITLQGYEINLPDAPQLETIEGYDKPIEEQYWKKSYLISDEEFDSLSVEQQEEIIERETKRRIFGHWFMNKGKPFYLTGDNYFFLQFWTIDGTSPQFIIAQAHDFYFDYHCDNDNRCFGNIKLKPRREGCTQRTLARACNKATLVMNKHFGIQSKTGDDAKKINFLNLVYGYRSLPDWMKPQTSGNDIPKTELVFDKPPKRMSETQKKLSASNASKMYLKTKIDYRSTVDTAYDGSKLFRYIMDECFAKGTKILCENLEFKNIEEIKVGDKVIVEGGKLMEVGATCYGIDEMFLVKQPYSKDYVVNSQHRLYLEQRLNTHKRSTDGIKHWTPIQFLQLDKSRKGKTFGVRSRGIELQNQFVPLDPYILGAWLGDGDSSGNSIAINPYDKDEVYDYIKVFAEKFGYTLHEGKTISPKCIALRIKKRTNERLKMGKSGNNVFQDLLKLIGVLNNKHIPHYYLNNSKDIRFKLLAGMLDTDGHLVFQNNSYHFELSQCREELALQFVTLCRSLGLKVQYKIVKTNFNTLSYRLCIYGDNLWEIPTNVKKKQVPKEYNRKHATHSNKVTSIESVGQGEYFGITLKAYNDDDRRLILEDFTLSMNCGKWESANAYETWGVVKKCLVDGFDIIGKACLLSTIGETDENAATNFVRLWNESDANKRTDNGYTVSGLYRWFIPSICSKRGHDPRTGKEITNKYGETDEVAARELLLNERKSITDPRKLFMEIKQNPLTIEEALNFGSSSAVFDTVRLNGQKNYLMNFEPTENRPVKYQIGNLVWINNEKFGKVQFVENPNGKWKIAYFPHIAGVEMVNRYKRLPNGRTLPYSNTQFVMGIDPFDYNADDMTNGKHSNGAFYVKLKYNFSVPDLSNIYCCQYFYREADANMFYDDCIKTAFFYGAKMNPERKLYGIWRYLRDNGLINWSMIRPDISKQSDFQKKDNGYGTPTGEDTKRLGAELVEGMIAKPDPLYNENLTDNLERFYFEEGIDQLMKYDPKRSTDYDLVMAMFMTEIGCQSIKKIAVNEENIQKGETLLDILCPKYDNSGGVSRLIRKTATQHLN
jgi:hypothetical protein